MKELKEWYKKVDDMYINKPLNSDEFEIFMHILCADVEELKVTKTPIIYLINKRASAIGLQIDIKTQKMHTTICGNPCDVVIYVSYLKCKAEEMNTSKITFNKFVDIFPNGYFNEKQLEKAWHLQKIGADNLLDNIKIATL